MVPEIFAIPDWRGERYTIIEVLMFVSRTTGTGKAFYLRVYRDVEQHLAIETIGAEITIVETPRHDWRIRGIAGDER